MVAGKHLVWVTAAGQDVDHAVTSRGLASAVGSVGAEAIAVCGQRFWAAPLIADPGQPCAPCARRAPMRGGAAGYSSWRGSDADVVASAPIPGLGVLPRTTGGPSDAQVTAPAVCRLVGQTRRGDQPRRLLAVPRGLVTRRATVRGVEL